MKTGIVAKYEKMLSLEKSRKEKANEDSLSEILAKTIEEVESKLMNSFQARNRTLPWLETQSLN